MQPESPGLVGPLARIVDTDSRVPPYIFSPHRYPSILEPDGFAGREIYTVETAIDLQRATEPPRSIDQLPIDINRPDQYGRGKFFPLRHHVQAMVHPVDEIDVRHPRWAKQHLRPLRSPFRSMAGFILLTDIGLHLDDFPC